MASIPVSLDKVLPPGTNVVARTTFILGQHQTSAQEGELLERQLRSEPVSAWFVEASGNSLVIDINAEVFDETFFEEMKRVASEHTGVPESSIQVSATPFLRGPEQVLNTFL